MSVRVFTDGSSQNNQKKEFGTEHFRLLINLSVKYSPGNPVADRSAVAGCPYVPPQSNGPSAKLQVHCWNALAS